MSEVIWLEDLPGHFQGIANELQSQPFDEELNGPIRDEVLKGHRDNFTSSATPDGASWPKRKRRGDGHPLLMETGALLQAATGGGPGHVTQVADNELLTGVDKSVDLGGIPGAGVHNFGYGAVPKREFLGVPEKRLETIDELVADAGLKAFE